LDKKLKNLFTVLIVIFSILTVIFIFTAGTEKSIFRKFTNNTLIDIIAAIICGAIVMFISFYYSMITETKVFDEIIKLNIKKIRRLKEKGWSDEKIAKDLANAMNLKRGFRHNYAVRKFILLLSNIDKIKEKNE
jgi:heme/copper-type cytochrome/quinol oxidase subunit 2